MFSENVNTIKNNLINEGNQNEIFYNKITNV